MEHNAKRGSRTLGTALLMNPKSWKWGGKHTKARVMHSAPTLFPICFFFLKYQKNKALQKCQGVRRKVESRKIQS